MHAINTMDTPPSFEFCALLQVVTLVGEPFVFIKSIPKSGKCEDLDNPDNKDKHVKCTGKVYGEHAKQVSPGANEHCCYGMSLKFTVT